MGLREIYLIKHPVKIECSVCRCRNNAKRNVRCFVCNSLLPNVSLIGYATFDSYSIGDGVE